MTDPRAGIFAAFRAAKPLLFNDAGNTHALDNLCDAFGIDRAPATRRAIGAAGAALIKRYEGCKLVAYLCPAGVWTIGWGATGAGIGRGTVWTQAQADARFEQDVQRFADDVSILIGNTPTTQGQFDAMVSFAFNLGSDIDADDKAEGLGDSTLLKKHLRGDYAGAAAEFGKWINAAGRPLDGLRKRRAEEAALYGRAG